MLCKVLKSLQRCKGSEKVVPVRIQFPKLSGFKQKVVFVFNRSCVSVVSHLGLFPTWSCFTTQADRAATIWIPADEHHRGISSAANHILALHALAGRDTAAWEASHFTTPRPPHSEGWRDAMLPCTWKQQKSLMNSTNDHVRFSPLPFEALRRF